MKYGRYVFYRKELFPHLTRPESIYAIMRDTIPYWKTECPDESKYVIEHSQYLETKVERNYAQDSIITMVVGQMSEQDYIMYKLKY